MKIAVTARHMTVSETLKEFIRSKSEHLGHYFDNIQTIEVILNPERDTTYSVEMVLHAPRHSVLVCHAGGKTATAAVDVVLGKMERLLTKYKDKIRSKSARERVRGVGRGKATRIAAAETLGDA